MTGEMKELVNALSMEVTACCSERKPTTMCFDCKKTLELITLIETQFNKDKP